MRRVNRSKTNLAPSPDRLFGRDEDLAALDRLLVDRARLLVLIGPPGVGKTRLAAEFARSQLPECTRRGAGGVWRFDLTDARGDGDAASAVARVLGVPLAGSDGSGAIARLGRAIADRGRVLLLLDNADAGVAWLREAAPAWLESAPMARLLVTSRADPSLPNAAIRIVEALPVPGEGQREIAAVARSAGVALFLDRARAVRPDWRPTGKDAPLVAEIVRRLDGIPLAIELAAARTKPLGLGALLGGLRERQLGHERPPFAQGQAGVDVVAPTLVNPLLSPLPTAIAPVHSLLARPG